MSNAVQQGTFARGANAAMTSLRALSEPQRGPALASLILVGVVAFLVLILFIWSRTFTLEIWASGIGRVIPSRQIQVVQNLEGGIVHEILVHEGDTVEAGEVVARIDGTEVESSYLEDRATWISLVGIVDRLKAEASDEPLVFSPELEGNSREVRRVVTSEREAYEARRMKLEAELAVLEAQRARFEQAAADAANQVEHVSKRLALLEREIAVVAPQVRRGLVSETELLKLQQQKADLDSRLAELQAAINSAQSSAAEAAAKKAEHEASFRAESFSMLAEKRAVLASLAERLVGSKDKVTRRIVRAPVPGVVKRVMITTPNEVVKPGDTILEIVPSDDALLVEARIRPEDIGFIREGQDAHVRLTAYDFSVYGAMPGIVDRVGADTLTTQEGESFYPVIVRVIDTGSEGEGPSLPILPGMIADVSIVTGERTIFDYAMKPIVKLQESAFRER